MFCRILCTGRPQMAEPARGWGLMFGIGESL
jgi:hypothetical protein